MNIPPIIAAGDTVWWLDRAFTSAAGGLIASPDYVLTYSLRGPVQSGNVDINGVADGGGWKVTITADQSAALNATATPNVWYWQAVATKGQERVTAGGGTLKVTPNIAGLPTNGIFDGRSKAEQDLAAVRAEISRRISGGATVEYTIGQRSLKKEPMSALVEIEERCLRIVARERKASAAANGLGNPGRLGVRFT
ncbi:hypothetical protein [Ideonella paludis]|uniref:Phage tail protein n=1 Tax=Ideonella paludis TaxID=1233411 RepID=A0ABS5DUT3_9BURK|nr:hypothetical protein [Ideonella paludis]MBQ0934641.1 hypothetical protein [Ideonella paludis]